MLPFSTVFQSTRPARGATLNELDIDFSQIISIHAPREGRDHVVGLILHNT